MSRFAYDILLIGAFTAFAITAGYDWAPILMWISALIFLRNHKEGFDL